MNRFSFLVLVLVASLATAAYEEGSCQREMMRHSIDRCQSFLQHGPRRPLIISSISSGNRDDNDENVGAPEECCMQLRDVREDCRCRSIRDMVQEVKWEQGFRGRAECRGRCREMMRRGRFLPAMCSMEPHTCMMRLGVGPDHCMQGYI